MLILNELLKLCFIIYIVLLSISVFNVACVYCNGDIVTVFYSETLCANIVHYSAYGIYVYTVQ